MNQVIVPQRRLGRLPSVRDKRVPSFALLQKRMVTPPDNIIWYADVPAWPMLANDRIGDCVQAASLHALQQFSAYAGEPIMPTETDAVDFYSGSQGYNPNNPATDKGSYVMGPGGTMEYWRTTGIKAAGKINKASAYFDLSYSDPVALRQGIFVFGGILAGINCPSYIVDNPDLPFVWPYQKDAASAGGHEVWINGVLYEAGEYFFNMVSWGRTYRMPLPFLNNYLDEAVVVYDRASLNTKGLDARGLTELELLSLMGELPPAV